MKRRKILAVSTCTLILSLLCACGAQDDIKSEDLITIPPIDVQVSESPFTAGSSGSANTQQPEATAINTGSYEICEDLEVVTSFIYDNYTYIVVENTGDRAVLNYGVAYINFDSNGFVKTTDSNGYESGKVNAANIIPGGKGIASWYGADGKYAVSAITWAEFADGSKWEMDWPENWANDARSTFTVDGYKAELEELKAEAVLAETNEYATLLGVKVSNENPYSTKLDFEFNVQNNSEQGITQMNVFVLEFDENGFPVSVSPYDTYCMNGHQTGGTVNLAAGESNSYVDDLFASPTTANIKVIISYIVFQDGTEWQNPYVYEWIVANNSSY